ncbi:Hint domain-containing protein [Roseovarius nanhaiticus]|uniref:Hint domain-containing protein n=1 Tax=Roseovarius nanhaiticus TaxID=573024 RepID=A0A1N7H7N4_9RHOB|nr:Hint domain-containing protein [Roseovarius nanhaiticus]SEL10239.1 Hint domain-containing protein [Roseovarius nanhaiticus]SIS20783.1 Hint domain-containing protein [Roseovarius nanhaiticus]
MGWIGIATHEIGRFDPAGLGAHRGAAAQSLTGNAEAGTILIDTYLSPDARPQTLIGFARAGDAGGMLSLKVVPTGGIVLIDDLGGDVRHAALNHDLDGRSDQVRVRYSWDSSAPNGTLTLKHLSSGTIRRAPVPTGHPIALEDLRMLTRFPAHRIMDPDVGFVAVSDEVEPIGAMPGLTGAVPIATPRGDVPVARLKRGDTVLTATGDVVPILRAVRQTVPAFGSLRPVRLRAPFFGLRHDIVIAPHQRLVIGGSEVEYMFGTEAALVPARHLVNGSSAYHGTGPDLVTYHHLLLPEHQAIIAAGCPVESLYIGRLRRDREALAASPLAKLDPSRLPEHARPIWPVLKPFEARTLAMHRAA